MMTSIKGVDLVCPYCQSHPKVIDNVGYGYLYCRLCNRQYSERAKRPSFLDDKLFPSGKFWKDPYLKTQGEAFILGISKKKICSLFEKLRAPRVCFRKLPHFDLLSTLSKRDSFKALYIGYNQYFDPDVSKNVVQLNVVPGEHVDVISMGEYIPFPDESFDLVVLSGVIEHTQDPFKVINESHRVLQASGEIYVSAPWVYPYHGGDNYRFSNEGLKLLCRQFDDVEIGSLDGPAHALAILLSAFIGETMSFGNRYVRYFFGIMTSWFFLPLRFLDVLTNRRKKNKYVLDANIYAIGTKKQNDR